ncbi:recombinase RecT, partial [Accumulibacter sp.]|uniref:recombinase RecT n=1 Tax=Accumulibacter sp. TaxID=2053492 RepID=UPI002C75613A
EVIGFYAVAKLKDGGHCFEFMSSRQIEKIRDGSHGYQQAVRFKNEDDHPWTKHFVEMGRKTVVRRLAKFLPLSIEFQTAAVLDSMAEAGMDQHIDSVDGDFWLAADDAPQGVDHETGEIITPAAQIEHQPPAMTIPQQTIQKDAEGALRQDQKEEAAIREREMEESGQPSTGRRIRQRGLDIE